MVMLVDGYEGTGKSVFAQQMAYYCDPTIDNDDICFTPKQFRKAIMTAKRYSSVVYDEAYTGLSSRAAMTLINRTLTSMLAEIRQKNLFVFIVMPTFFDLDKYPALWRSRALFHVYSKGFARGYFMSFDADRKKDLYVLGKKFYSYRKPKANFIGRFTNHYTVDEEEYRLKKKSSLIDREKAKEDIEKRKEFINDLFERLMHIPTEQLPHKTKMLVLSMPHSTYFDRVRKWKELQELNEV